jgi:hypothetical protein
MGIAADGEVCAAVAETKTDMSSNPLDYYIKQHAARQWQGFLGALAAEFQEQLDAASLRALMSAVGTRFAKAHPLPDCSTLAAMAHALNTLWAAIDWGYVELSDQTTHLDIRHLCAPLSAFGPSGATWAPAFLEGAYRHWMNEAGALGLSCTQLAGGSPTDLTFRMAR